MSDHPRSDEASIWYYASLALVGVTLLLTICSVFDPRPGHLGFLCFIGVFAMYASSGSSPQTQPSNAAPNFS